MFGDESWFWEDIWFSKLKLYVYNYGQYVFSSIQWNFWGMFVYSYSLSALVNGRPMVWKRLRREDPLSQFLYLINVVEGLTGMI